jgi:hypothetical protein
VDSTIRELRRAVRGPHDWTGIERVALARLRLGPRQGYCGLVSDQPNAQGLRVASFRLGRWTIHISDRGFGRDSWLVSVAASSVAGVPDVVLRDATRSQAERFLAAVEAGCEPASPKVRAFARGPRARQEAS